VKFDVLELTRKQFLFGWALGIAFFAESLITFSKAELSRPRHLRIVSPTIISVKDATIPALLSINDHIGAKPVSTY
jgi:hypothetical protein